MVAAAKEKLATHAETEMCAGAAGSSAVVASLDFG
jgi:hypothetical protein